MTPIDSYHFNELELPNGGRLGLGCCPGHRLTPPPLSVRRMPGSLKYDLKAIAAWKPDAVLSLMEEPELASVGAPVKVLAEELKSHGVAWHHLPICDMDAPESRALALEGTYTRLPADQLVIQQIEQAGVATLQETATTVAARFASIKMTLLSIHGAFAVKGVQQIAARQARLDKQLTDIRERALKDVAVTAAQAPGENRLAQAEQIAQVIAATKEIRGLVEAAKKTTEEKFAAAREKFAAARAEFASLSHS